MSMALEPIISVGAAAIATVIAAGVSQFLRPYIVDQKDRREKARSKLKEQIKKKVQGGISLEAQEVADIGRGLGLSSAQSIDVLYQLYSEAEEKEHHSLFKSLIYEINKSEPYESLPEEVRPSLARLSTLCVSSNQDTDKELLHPITKVLTEYQEMKRDHASLKKQGRISYVVALVSFFIGIVGLILAFSGPSKDFIKEEISKSTMQIEQQIKTAQPGNQADGK